MNAIEAVLVAQGRAAASAGHPNLRGGPREWFVRDFLEGHLPSTLETGQGEIINANSIPQPPPRQYRPQVDVVLYQRDFPKIPYGGDNTAFLQEGVAATIEVKTKLTKEELAKACKSSVVHKSLKYTESGVKGVVIGDRYPTNIVSYVVAFDGPAKMATIAKWMQQIQRSLNSEPDQLVEMIIVLGKGVLWRILSFQGLRNLKYDPQKHHWAYVQQKDNNLLMMFVHMLFWMAQPSVLHYVRRISIKGASVI